MNREIHVRFWEGLGVRFPRATHCGHAECYLVRVTKSLIPANNRTTCSFEYSEYFPCAALFRRSSHAVIDFWSSLE